MSWKRLLLCVIACVSLVSGRVLAEGLRVSPVLLEVTAPGAAASLTLRNEGRHPITVQARVFRWVQAGGRERFEATSDVVVSPPMTQVAPGAQKTIRVVRTQRAPVRGEEAYRMLIDEVPDRMRRQAGRVSFATRLRIPVFFTEPSATLPYLRWAVRRSGDAAFLEAQNAGQVRMRLADVRLARGGNAVYRRDGLFGYVLGGATMHWPLGPATRIGTGGLDLQASSSRGPLSAAVPGH